MKKHRWLGVAVPVVLSLLLAQLACGDDGGDEPFTGTGTGGDDFVDAAPAQQPDATIPDSTVPDSTVPDSTVPDSTVPDATLPDATDASDAADATDAKPDADGGGPICTVAPRYFDGGLPYYSFDVDVKATAGTCAVKPSVQSDDPNVQLVINFDPGATSFNVYAMIPYEIVSIAAVKALADGGSSPVDAGGTNGSYAQGAFDQTITLKFRQTPSDAGDAGASVTRTMVFKVNSVVGGANTLTLFSFN